MPQKAQIFTDAFCGDNSSLTKSILEIGIQNLLKLATLLIIEPYTEQHDSIRNMKKKLLPIFIIVLAVNCANGQITKGNWMVGGNGSFSSQKEILNSIDVKGIGIHLSPSAGYFFVNKLAGGLRARFDYAKVEYTGVTSNSSQFGFGPFIRYYFLTPEKNINLFAESAYQYSRNSGSNSASQNSNAFTFSAGPVIYLNSSVGIELTASYELYDIKATGVNTKTFFLSIGFQIHLLRESNNY